jgi:hypothetical protein
MGTAITRQRARVSKNGERGSRFMALNKRAINSQPESQRIAFLGRVAGLAPEELGAWSLAIFALTGLIIFGPGVRAGIGCGK